MKTIKTSLISPAYGTERNIVSHHFGNAGQGEKIFIQAALHADETPAMLATVRLREKLLALDDQGRLNAEIVLVPVANPIGLSQQVLGQFLGRFEIGNGQNFNRHFPFLTSVGDKVAGRLGSDPQANRDVIRETLRVTLAAAKPLTEFDSLQHALLGLSIDADLVLDLHCSLEAAMHIYTSEAAWPEVEPLARYLGAAASLLATDSGGDAFDEVHSRLWWTLRERFGETHPIPHACAAVTVECRGQRDVDYEHAEHDASAIVDFLMYRGAITGAPRVMPALLTQATPLAGSEQFHAPTSGILVHRATIGERVEVGVPLFDIIDPHDGTTTTIHSKTAGVFYMRRAIRFVHQGAPLGRVTGTVAFRTGTLLGA